ncbi:MAG: winged helix-turn-helix domain-containing protein [Cyanobacteria bacterium REEB67]|nr:winged helix-turn-helix domain-containing protein [Cyanobacteria bacterium REEB67]
MTLSQRNQKVKLSEFKADFFKALSNPVRIRILDELRDGELTVSEIRDRINVELPNVSQQLAVLKSKNLVVYRKEGVTIFYACSDPKIFRLLDVAKEIFNGQLSSLQKTIRAL